MRKLNSEVDPPILVVCSPSVSTRQFSAVEFADPEDLDSLYEVDDGWSPLERGLVFVYTNAGDRVIVNMPYRIVDMEVASILRRLKGVRAEGEYIKMRPDEDQSRLLLNSILDSFSMPTSEFGSFRSLSNSNGWILRDGCVDFDTLHERIKISDKAMQAAADSLSKFKEAIADKELEKANALLSAFSENREVVKQGAVAITTDLERLRNEKRHKEYTQAYTAYYKVVSLTEKLDQTSLEGLYMDLAAVGGVDGSTPSHTTLHAELARLKALYPNTRYVSAGENDAVVLTVMGVKIVLGDTIEIKGDLASLRKYEVNTVEGTLQKKGSRFAGVKRKKV